MQTATEKRYLTPKEVSKIIGVNVETVSGWIRKKKIPAIKIGRKSYVRKDFEEYLSTIKEAK